jgi:hypothetical protein
VAVTERYFDRGTRTALRVKGIDVGTLFQQCLRYLKVTAIGSPL